MNRYLLDTHIFLWSLLDTQRITKATMAILSDPQNKLYLSPVSIWETMILAEKKRIQLNGAPEAWLREILSKVPLREAPLNHEVALQSRTIELPHQDPADRFIAASAIVYDLTLLTSDRNLIEAAGLYTVHPN